MKTKSLICAAACGLMLATACKSKSSSGSADSTADSTKKDTAKVDTASLIGNVKPKGHAPAWATGIKPQKQAFLEKLVNSSAQP